MNVWKISYFKVFMILDSIEDVIREVTNLMEEIKWSKGVGEEIKISFEEMSKKDYENLPEFDAWC